MNKLRQQILQMLDEDKKELYKIYNRFLEDHAYLWDKFEDLEKLREILLVIIKLFYHEHRQLKDVSKIEYEVFKKSVRELLTNRDALLQKARKAQVDEIEFFGPERWFEMFRKDIERINRIIQKYEAGSVNLSQFPDLMNECKILGLPEGATLNDARSEYRRIALNTHPDRFPGDKEKATMFREATDAIRRIENRAEGKSTSIHDNGEEEFKDIISWIMRYGLTAAIKLDLEYLSSAFWGLEYHLGHQKAKESKDLLANQAAQSLIKRIREHAASMAFGEIITQDGQVYDFLKAKSHISLDSVRNEVRTFVNRCFQDIVNYINSRGKIREGYAVNLELQNGY